MRLARRRAGAAAGGLFPSMRRSSARSGATAAALARSLRASAGSAQQRHWIRAGRRGHGAAVRSNGGAARPLEHAAIFSCHGEAGGGGARMRQGGSREAEGRGLKGWPPGASLLPASDRDREGFGSTSAGEVREMVRVYDEGFIRSLQIAWMENMAAEHGAGSDRGRRAAEEPRRRLVGPRCQRNLDRKRP
jgi:hypothetical protein